MDGQILRFTHYREARDPLVRRIGDYWSYCEIPKPDGPDVEHIRVKDIYPQYKRSWTNFLLACRYCNSVKGDRVVVLNRYYWPQRHNTFLALTYSRTGIAPAAYLTPTQRSRAQATIGLTGLDRRPGHPQFSDRDTRWRKREEVWSHAQRSLENLHKNNTQFEFANTGLPDGLEWHEMVLTGAIHRKECELPVFKVARAGISVIPVMRDAGGAWK